MLSLSQLWFLLERSRLVPRPTERWTLPQHEPARHQGDGGRLRKNDGGEHQAEGRVVQDQPRSLALGE